MDRKSVTKPPLAHLGDDNLGLAARQLRDGAVQLQDAQRAAAQGPACGGAGGSEGNVLEAHTRGGRSDAKARAASAHAPVSLPLLSTSRSSVRGVLLFPPL